jgi:hypothetical protein
MVYLTRSTDASQLKHSGPDRFMLLMHSIISLMFDAEKGPDEVLVSTSAGTVRITYKSEVCLIIYSPWTKSGIFTLNTHTRTGFYSKTHFILYGLSDPDASQGPFCCSSCRTSCTSRRASRQTWRPEPSPVWQKRCTKPVICTLGSSRWCSPWLTAFSPSTPTTPTTAHW